MPVRTLKQTTMKHRYNRVRKDTVYINLKVLVLEDSEEVPVQELQSLNLKHTDTVSAEPDRCNFPPVVENSDGLETGPSKCCLCKTKSSEKLLMLYSLF
jgi:hypothetical protein